MNVADRPPRDAIHSTPVSGAVIVAHGERGGSFSNAIVKGHAVAASKALPDVAVAAGVLSGEPTFEAALAEVASRTDGEILIYPFFMAPGYFVNTKIPKRIADAGLAERCRILETFGSSAPLPAVILQQALASASELGAEPQASRLLLVGHGSKVSRASAEATEAVAACLRALGGFGVVATAFLEEAPFVEDVVLSDNHRPTVVVGFFNGDGLHAAEDVPQMIGKFDGPIGYTGPVGAFDDASRLIADVIHQACTKTARDTSA